jgi:hypothetical protein
VWWFHITSPLAEIKSSLRWILVMKKCFALWLLLLLLSLILLYYYYIPQTPNILWHNFYSSLSSLNHQVLPEKKIISYKKTQSCLQNNRPKWIWEKVTINDKNVFFNKKFLKKKSARLVHYIENNLCFLPVKC